jgi:hypothetical protein
MGAGGLEERESDLFVLRDPPLPLVAARLSADLAGATWRDDALN